MIAWPFYLGLGITVVVFGVLAWILTRLSARRNRETGATGFTQRSRLTCPKCHQVFDYDWIPGAALTAVRLGKDRYMACPLCGKWSMFNVWDAPSPASPTGFVSPPR